MGVDGVGDICRAGLRSTERAYRTRGTVPEVRCALLRLRDGCSVVRGQALPGSDHEHAHPRRGICGGAHDAGDKRLIIRTRSQMPRSDTTSFYTARRSSCALIATTTVLSDMSTAPSAGCSRIPQAARTPPARGMATML